MRKISILVLMFVLLMSSTISVSAETVYRTLRNGEESADVATMQQALIDLKFLNSTADGKYGTRTENAVRDFQKKYRMNVDGIAGNKTLTKLYELAGVALASAPTQTTPPATATQVPSSGGYATLEYGSQGESVKALQQALNNLGYNCGTADGKFGTATANAVKAFQRVKGLTPDGKAGKNTLTALYQAPAAPAPTQTPAPESGAAATQTPASSSSVNKPTQSLRLGMKGNDVKALQQKLNEKGYSVGTADGVYGTKTMTAVKDVQKAFSLTVDGIAGTKTYNVLWTSNAASQTETPTASPTAPPSADPETYATLTVGDKGEAVKKMQIALKNLNYTVSTDGDFGGQTKIAVTAFQQQNNLTADGVAGSATLSLLYSGNGKKYVAPDNSNTTVKTGGGPSKDQVQLLHWFDSVKPSLRAGNTLFVYDPATNLNWSLRAYSLGRHCDSEPLTQQDTDSMFKAFGNKNTWTQKAVYVRLPDGRWTLAATHNVPHLSGSIKDNGFDGHLCVHFLRDMAEAEKNDPDYGVSNQKTIRKAWTALTGQTYQEKK